MPRDSTSRGVRSWPIWGISPGLRAYVLAADTVIAAWIIVELATGLTHPRGGWLILCILFALAVAFEEGATRIARLQWRLSSELKQNMVSVWAVAAAVALPPAQATVLVLAVITHVWWRQQRPGGQPAYRAWFSATVDVSACLTAGYAVRASAATWSALPWALAGSLSVILAIAVYTVINRALITLALIGSGARGRMLMGSLDDNLTELSTLCLGGLVGIAATHEPWLCILALLPMAMLQRGAFVRELETAAVTDTKTGLLNAIGWEHLAGRELGRARREQYPLSILIVDIDYFKRVNDSHGHIVGDYVLRGVARAMKGALREYDGVGRFGGEEFVAVLPDSAEVDAVEVAERIRSRVNELTIATASGSAIDDDTLLSVSVGVACAAPEQLADTELTAMLVSADQALYRAKSAGRNRVCLAGEPDEQNVAVPGVPTA